VLAVNEGSKAPPRGMQRKKDEARRGKEYVEEIKEIRRR